MATYDILLTELASYDQTASPISFSIASAMAVTGIQKAAQYFLVALLTRKGTIPTDPDYGTLFMTQLTSGQVNSNADVTSAFNTAVAEILRYQAATRDLAGLPADEVITAAQIQNMDVARGRVQLTFQLVTAAGTARVYQAPLPNLPS